MSARDPRATLRQIEDAARRLQLICAGLTLATLLADWQATAAMERFLEVMGEALAIAGGLAVAASVRALKRNRRHPRPFEPRLR